MYDIFNRIRLSLEEDKTISSKTLITLNPSSQVCYDDNGKQVGSCLRQVWLTKNDYPKTNPIGINAVMSGFSGNWWEDWFITQLKELGLYYNSQFPATDVDRLVKGIVDVATINPDTGEKELGEIKTYNGSNYTVAQNIIGNKKVSPRPNTKHLLQAFRYSLIFKDIFSTNNLYYIDRSCSSWARNKQFKIQLVEVEDKIRPKISTVWNNEYYEYIDKNISDVGIYTAEETLLQHIGEGTIPDKEFIESYTSDLADYKYSLGEIPEYVYKNYKKDPINNPVGDFNCKYCPFSRGTCKNAN